MIQRGMTVQQGWGGINATSMLGVPPAEFSAGPIPSMGAMPIPARPQLDANADKPWHPDSPLFWFGVVLATTFGLIGAATSIRVGPYKAAVSAGTP